MNCPTQLQRDASDTFWDALAPCEHLVQIYEEEGTFLDSLETFVLTGLRKGEAVIVIATPDHLKALEERLFDRHGINLRSKGLRERYFAFDAAATLERFMVDGWPDENRFRNVVFELLEMAGSSGRKVRAFGEMVVLLWEAGLCDATVRLEELWHGLCHEKEFSLFCAYPKNRFIKDAEVSIRRICATHSRLVTE